MLKRCKCACAGLATLLFFFVGMAFADDIKPTGYANIVSNYFNIITNYLYI